MSNLEPVYLKIEDLEILKKREIGRGTDGIVVKYDRKYLVKLYHRKLIDIMSILKQIDDQTKEYKMGDIKGKINEPFNYYMYNENNDEHIKLQSKYAIRKAMERQKNITRTRLPQNIVYLNNQFAGCLLEYIRGTGIYSLTGMPLKYKKIIFTEVIKSVRELLDNNIYHIDLNNRPQSRALYKDEEGIVKDLGHSHVLVNPLTLKTNIIDLDGKSTIYTERYSEEYELEVLRNLCELLIEFLLTIDTYELKKMADELADLPSTLEEAKEIFTKSLANELEKLHIEDQYIEKLSTFSLNIDEMKNFVKTL